MADSRIEWTGSTWNPVTGCTKISEGCRYCYAERMAIRLKAMGQTNYRRGFDVCCHDQMLNVPLKWKRPKIIFVNSMGDLFHEEVPDTFIISVFNVMVKANWHIYQVLTKRAERLAAISAKLPWPSNIWMGVTVESDEHTCRVDSLRKSGAMTKFLSMEPLLGPVPSLNLDHIDWVIVGGESGPHSRPMEESWVLDIKSKCDESKVPFFFKQWGGVNKKRAGRLLNGRTWDAMPHNIAKPVKS